MRSQVSRLKLALVALVILAMNVACPKEEFPEIGENFAGPVATEVSPDNQYFYILNSDFEWTYNQGSILVVDTAGQKVAAHVTHRMGRSMKVRGNRMVITFDRQDADDDRSVRYYDLSDPVNPALVHTWYLPCDPLNAEFSQTSAYFFVSCRGGDLYVGSFADPSLFKIVRSFGRTRRAMYLDDANQLLYSFVTDLGRQSDSDKFDQDKVGFDKNGTEVEGENEIPDSFEDSKTARRRPAARYVYQFTVVDIAEMEQGGFQYHSVGDPKDPQASYESRFLYYFLNNADGVDDSPDVDKTDMKYYRTNFWDAVKHPSKEGVFYLSHRGNSEGANNIVRVDVIGDPRAKDQLPEGGCSNNHLLVEEKCIPLLKEYMTFNRVYGFQNEVKDLHYPGEFVVQKIQGRLMTVVNHFRDLVYWPPDKREFAIESKVLQENGEPSTSPIQREAKSSHIDSYFQIAVTPEGQALTCSFYGNSAVLMSIVPEVPIEVVTRIQ